MNNLETTPGNLLTTSRRPRRFLRVILRIMLLLLFIIGLFLSCFPLGRASIRSAIILPALISGSQPASLIALGDPIQHTQVTMPSSSGIVNLDVYQPTASTPLIASARSGVLIIPGVGDNRQDPQLINLSETMARAGLVVMDMLTPTLANYTISADDSDATIQAFEALNHLPSMKDSRSGIIAFSGGVPLASFAAADPRIRTQVAYLALFGGYFNTTNVIRAFGQRAIEIDGKHEKWEPTIVPLQTIANIITQDFTTNEQYLIKNSIHTNIPIVASDLKTLSPGAQAAYHLLTGDEPEQVNANIAALPLTIHALLGELSPGRAIQQIHAPVYLLHDRNDTSIPVTESRDFATALAKLHHPYDYVEFHIFNHVEVRANLDLGLLIGDGLHLLSILDKILLASS